MTETTCGAASLEINLLGSFRIAVDGVPVEENRWQRRKPQLLIKLLALQPFHRLNREQLMEMLWPEMEPVSAANNLHKSIYLARRALEPFLGSGNRSHFILIQGQQVILRAPESLWIDADEFERRAGAALKNADLGACLSALSIYRGDLLSEDIYCDWTVAKREQLRTLHRNLLAKLADVYESQKQYGQSIECLKELLTRDRADEDAHRQLMRLYALTGYRHLALRQYRQCCEAIRQDLDVEPDQETEELYARIKSGDVESALESDQRADINREAGIESLAVLPLVNLSADTRMEYLSDGITENIINSLSQLAHLKVMAQSTVLRYKNKAVDPQKAGSELGVQVVLTGRLALVNDHLVIGVEMVRASDGSQLWGEKYNRKITDIFSVQEEIASEISDKLKLKLTAEDKKRLKKRYTENTEAYHLYLKGRHHWNKRTVEGMRKGITYFERAIEADPAYALAYAGLADCYNVLSNYGAPPPRESFPRAKAAAMKALEFDGSLAEAYTSLGFARFWYDWNWSDAGKDFERALALNPNYATAHHWYGLYLMAGERWDEAIREMETAQQIDPLSPVIGVDFARLFYYCRRYEQALENLGKTLEMSPDFVRTRLWLGMCYERMSMFEQAAAEIQSRIDAFGNYPGALSALGSVYAASGRKEQALRTVEELEVMSNERYVAAYFIAVIYAGLGEKERAFEWLERAYQERSGWMVWLAVDPRLDPLRPDARFKDLLLRVGFPA